MKTFTIKDLKAKQKYKALVYLNDEKLSKYVRLSSVIRECTNVGKTEAHRRLRRDDYQVQLDKLKELFNGIV